MNDKDRERLRIYEEHIAQLRSVANDDALNKNWKLFCFHEIFRALDEALAELERSE